MSDSLWPHKSQHTRPPCPSPTPRVYPNPCPLSRWCHPAISSSVILFSSCPQSFPASGSFPVNQLFAWGDQSIGVSPSVRVSQLLGVDSDYATLGSISPFFSYFFSKCPDRILRQFSYNGHGSEIPLQSFDCITILTFTILQHIRTLIRNRNMLVLLTFILSQTS